MEDKAVVVNAQNAANIITLKEVWDWSRQNRRWISIGGVAGLLLSAIYLAITPPQYSAQLQIQMAQFVSFSRNTNDAMTFGNIEEPVALIQRLRFPTAYSIEARQGCGKTESEEFGDFMGGVLKVETVKNIANAVQMEVRMSSVQQAGECAEAIVSMIKEQQRDMIEERLAGRREQLKRYQSDLDAELRQLGGVKKQEAGNFSYLAKLDQLSWLRSRIAALTEEAALSQEHPVKQVTKTYVSSKPVSPRKKLVLLLGLLSGLAFGAVFAFFRKRGI